MELVEKFQNKLLDISQIDKSRAHIDILALPRGILRSQFTAKSKDAF